MPSNETVGSCIVALYHMLQVFQYPLKLPVLEQPDFNVYTDICFTYSPKYNVQTCGRLLFFLPL